VPHGPERLEQLAARVVWLDRYRRVVAIGVAMILAPLLLSDFTDAWPQFFRGAMYVSSGALLWWLTETVLAAATALFETEAEQLARDRGLPRAIVRK
jgi:hypothetical protein